MKNTIKVTWDVWDPVDNTPTSKLCSQHPHPLHTKMLQRQDVVLNSLVIKKQKKKDLFAVPVSDATLHSMLLLKVHLPLSAVTPCQSTRGSSSVPATAAVQPSDLLPCMRRLDVRCQVDLRWKQCFEGTADEMLGHSEKVGGVVVTWKCWRLTVRVLPSFPEICQHIQYIWIQTELTNPHYVASCVTANCLFQSLPVLLYNKCCIYPPGKDLWWVSALKCWCNSALYWLDYFLSGSIHLIWSCHHFFRSCFNYRPYFCSDESSLAACVLKRRMKAKEDNNIHGDNRSLSAACFMSLQFISKGDKMFYKQEHALQRASGM